MKALYFFTATILQWKPLLKPDKYKDIIIESLQFLVREKRVRIFAFVIMPNHLHLIWEINIRFNKSDVQRDFLKYTAQQIKRDLKKNHPNVLSKFQVNAKDRRYQIWERNPLPILLILPKVMEQKVNYIHWNPIVSKWKLAEEPQHYRYSSAKFYYEGIDEFCFLENYMNV